MDEFRHTYAHLCKDNHIETQDCVIAKLKSSSTSKPVLNLSTNSLTAKTCAVLGKVLATDRTFVEVKLADCMLSEDAVKGISHGFSNNVFCKKLDLKGNNIRASGAEAIGRMLNHNSTLTSLCLEWNAMGMLENSFAVICEGIGSNHSLQALDLRNNQISHDGAADIAANLKRNSVLKSLDLRWNNIGLLGGRALLEMLQNNKTLTNLELAGNNIPSDVVKAIDTAISHNQDRQLITEDYSKRSKTLTHQIHRLEDEKNLQANDLMNTIDKQEELLRKSKRTSARTVGQLQEALEERKSAFNALTAKLCMTSSELALAEQKASDYNILLTRLKLEMTDVTSVHQGDVRREREERANVEMRLLKDLSEANDRNIIGETKVQDLERKCRMQQDQIYELKEQITHLQADFKLRGSQFDERIQAEKQRHNDQFHDYDQGKQKELSRVKQEADEIDKTLRSRIQRMEHERLDLEQEVGKLKTVAMADKLQVEEDLRLVKHKLKTEQEQYHQQLEEKIRVLQIGKEDLQTHSNQQSSLVTELQSKNSHLTLDVENLKRQLDELNQDLAGKNSHTLAEVGKVKIDLNQTMSKLEAERQMHTELRDKLSQTDKQLSAQLLQHRDIVEEKDREIISLQDKLKGREHEILRIREDESQRAQMLQSAILNYVSKSPAN